MLLQLLRGRLAACGPGSQVSLAAGALERQGIPSVVFRAVHQTGGGAEEISWAEPEAVVRLVHELDGEFRVRQDRSGSFATAVRLTALSE